MGASATWSFNSDQNRFESGWLELRRGGFRNMKKVLVHDGPLSVTRWRYALGPCSCSAVADPAKEG